MGAEPRTGLDFEPPGYEEPSFDWVEGYKAGREAGLAAYKAELAEKVRALPGYIEQRGSGALVEYVVLRAAVLALLEAEPLQIAQEAVE